MRIDARKTEWPRQEVVDRAQPDVNGDPPVWRLYLALASAPSYTAVVSIHGITPYEAIGILARWDVDDFAGGPEFEDGRVAMPLRDDDVLNVMTVELE